MKGSGPVTDDEHVELPPAQRGNPNTSRGGRREAARLREIRALELSLAGRTHTEIAQAIGVANTGTVTKIIQRAMAAEAKAGAADRQVALERALMRVERLIRALWTRCLQGDVKAIAEVRALLDRQSKYLGLDRPVRFEVTDAMDAQIESLLEEMARLEREAALKEANGDA